jgi:hypothetical protein
MSFKTERLLALFPDAYAVRDSESVSFKLLDTVGAELMTADAKLKALLKSHWVRHASGLALDGLGSVFGVTRRVLRSGQPEPDESFRRRLIATVPLFTGGGTVEAIKGAVRSALGLPYDLDDLQIPAALAALRRDIERLIQVIEFTPVVERVSGVSEIVADSLSEATVGFDLPSVSDAFPRIEWTFTHGGGRTLVLERTEPGAASGVRSDPSFLVPPGKTLVLSAEEDGRLSAVIDAADVTPFFSNLDGSRPALLPPIPVVFSEWRFRSGGGLFDISTFDEGDAFAPARFRVDVQRVRLQRLTFDVEVPYFLEQVVRDLARRDGFSGELLVFEGLPREQLQGVVDQAKAAGVRGSVRFSLNFFERHEQRDASTIAAVHHVGEDHSARDTLVASSVNAVSESLDSSEHFAVGGVFDFSTFDGVYGFQ